MALMQKQVLQAQTIKHNQHTIKHSNNRKWYD